MEHSPKRFEDRDSASAWLTVTFSGWLASLTADEHQAVGAYKLDAYEPINEALRFGYETGEESAKLIANLDRALARFRLPEPIIVFRGFVNPAVRDLPVGREFVDFGYASTSLLRVIAEDIIASHPYDQRFLGEIFIPGGAHIGAYVAAPDLVREYGEVEILLPRESRFRITGRQAPDHLELEVIIR